MRESAPREIILGGGVLQKIKNLKIKIIATAAVAAVAAALYFFKIPCPWLVITGVRCLGCGMTRAVAALLSFDFLKATEYHIMVWSLPVLYFCFLRDGKPFSKTYHNLLLYLIIAVGFIANWLLHFFG